MATLSFLPIVQAFTKGMDISLEMWDISLAGRILANFPESLSEGQRIPDYLTMMGELTQLPDLLPGVRNYNVAVSEADGTERWHVPMQGAAQLYREVCAQPTMSAPR